MAQPNYPKPGSLALMRGLERAFGKKLTIDEKRPPPNAPTSPKNRKKRVSFNNEGDVDLKMKAWDSLNIPQYDQDFEHVFFQIGFIDFIKDLEKLNDGLILPLHVVKQKWDKLMENKFDLWDCENICAGEKKYMLVQALNFANEDNYETYRAGKNGVDEHNALEAERNTKNAVASKAGKSRKARKRAERQRRAERKMGGDVTMGNTLTKQMGVKKRTKRSRDYRYEPLEDLIASRLRSMVDPPELPPILANLVAGVPKPVPDLDEDVKMEL